MSQYDGADLAKMGRRLAKAVGCKFVGWRVRVFNHGTIELVALCMDPDGKVTEQTEAI